MVDRRIVAAVALCVCLVTPVALGAGHEELAAEIQEILERSYPTDAPGAALIAVDDGEVIFSGASGMANVELDVPLTAESVFRLGSITKQFTAVAMLQLVEAGKLSLNDPVKKYLPDYESGDESITVRHLLSHTSGLFNYTNSQDVMDRASQAMTTDEMLDSFEEFELDFAPGERWSYSNTGYVVAGAIIEEVSGMSYPDYVAEKIFEPLGMTSSYYGSHSRVIPNRASGYGGSPGNYNNAQHLSMTIPHAAGALLSTVGDMARWNAALNGTDLLNEESRKLLFTEQKLNDGEGSGYALGFMVSSFQGHPQIAHGGGIFGFTTYAMRLPGEDIYVAVLSNNTGSPVSTSYVAQKIAALVLGEPLPDFEAVELDPEIQQSYTGVYRIDEETARVVTFEDGQLYTQRTGSSRLPVYPHSEAGFFYRNSFTHFKILKDASGKVEKMAMYQNGSDEPEIAVWTDEPLPTREVADVDPEIYERYVGTYNLMPGFDLTIRRDGDRLLGQATGQPEAELFPESETKFFLKVVEATLTFVPGEGGKAGEVVLHQAGQEMRGKRAD